MKFTFKGYIKIDLKQVKIFGKKAIKFSIKDTGCGMKKKDQNKIFQLFQKLDITNYFNKSGTGIGLYQSQKFAMKLGFAHLNGI